MVLPPPPELNDTLTVLQLRVQWTLGNHGRGENSWSFIMIRNGLVNQPLLIWDMWEAACKGFWIGRLPQSLTVERALVEDRYPAVRPTLEVTLNEPGGGSSDTSAPPQCAPVISWRTHWPGRSYRGRTYLPPPMRDDLDFDWVTTACRNNIEHFVDSMMETFTGGFVGETSPQFAIVSRRHNNVPEPVGRFALVSEVRTVNYMGSQRRRMAWFAL
jgi:hypothetical protein